jgi:hypothetical protein
MLTVPALSSPVIVVPSPVLPGPKVIAAPAEAVRYRVSEAATCDAVSGLPSEQVTPFFRVKVTPVGDCSHARASRGTMAPPSSWPTSVSYIRRPTT